MAIIESQRLPENPDAAEQRKASWMSARFVVADAQTTELIEPSDRPLDNLAPPPQAAAVLRPTHGIFILTTLRPVGAAFWVALIAWMINPRWVAWSAVPVPVSLRWAGVGVLIGAGALLLWTFRSLGPNLTDTVVTRRKHALVMRGPYRWVRHPLYVSAALLTVAISLVAANWFLVVTGVIVFGLLVIRTRIEEENLIARFGNDYRLYMQRTGRFLPRIGVNRRDA